MLDLSTYLSAAAIAALPANVTTKEAADWKYLQAVALVESGVHYNTIVDGGRALEPWLRPAFEQAHDDAARLRVVVDQVASLTDVSIMDWHRRLVR